MTSSTLLRAGLAAVLAAASLGACDGDRGARRGAASTPFVAPTPTPVQERPPSVRRRPVVTNEARGMSRRRIETAIADLKEVSLWRPLTRKLYSLQLQSDPGPHGLPEDGHLADAMLSAVVDRDGAGTHCSVRFYPAAMKTEIETLARGYAQGVLGPPPTLRQLWGVILAHELAHCRNWDGGEPFAERWEDRVLDAFRAEGIE